MIRRFGISTHLYRSRRLTSEHLQDIAAHGFETVELFATRWHFDYHNPANVADLQQWLARAGLELNSIHAPMTESLDDGQSGRALSIASADADLRAHALDEVTRALHVARSIPVRTLVVHLGVPRAQQSHPGEHTREAARRSVEELVNAARPLGVQIALEVIPNELSRAGTLVHFIEEVLETGDVGICLDFGHAHLEGDLVEAIETVSGNLIATHLHDNRLRRDDHLVPFDGTIDWAAALTALQKVGYEGVLLFEVAANGSPREVLEKAQRARQHMELLLAL
jgi:sugar phosphate isomerase/epimerase